MACNHRLGDLGIAREEVSRLRQRALKIRAGDAAYRMAPKPSLPHPARRNGAATPGRHERAMDAARLRV